ncbi:hypothetical protein MJM99_33895, partial [Salmonella enterica subsp. enterica serovar Kentucky]|nr:hypothetical protein [Salmonella enterica subsp. enterica serovar Kentucky]
DIAEYGLKPLTESLRIANDLRCPVAIHSTHPVVPMKELVSLLPRYQKALAEAEADVAYYQVLAQEKRQEASRRNRLGVQAMSRE